LHGVEQALVARRRLPAVLARRVLRLPGAAENGVDDIHLCTTNTRTRRDSIFESERIVVNENTPNPRDFSLPKNLPEGSKKNPHLTKHTLWKSEKQNKTTFFKVTEPSSYRRSSPVFFFPACAKII
jgi:hypothetical protein